MTGTTAAVHPSRLALQGAAAVANQRQRSRCFKIPTFPIAPPAVYDPLLAPRRYAGWDCLFLLVSPLGLEPRTP